MRLQELTLYAFGAVGISQPVDTVVCTINNLGRGRWRIWGQGKHSTVDGLKLTIGSTDIVQFAMSDYQTVPLGPFVVDILNNTDDVFIRLAAATSGTGLSSANLYAEKIYP